MTSKQSINIELLNSTIALIATTLIVYILVMGKNILQPIIMAIVIWYLISRLTNMFTHIPGSTIKIPKTVALIIALFVTVLVVYAFITLITHSINNIINDTPKYQVKLKELLVTINSMTHANLNLSEFTKHINLASLFSNLALALTNVASNMALIIIYVLFILIEQRTFNHKLVAMTNNHTRYKKIHETIQRISVDINMYLKVKTGVSLLTAILTYIVLLSFGINYAQFWAVLIFLLNYIPTIGSIVGVLIILLAVSIQFTSIGLFILLMLLLIAVQFIVGNIVEPKLMGKNLNLSPIVILISLGFWGSIWGLLGMFLCVPFMTILNIILSKFKNTHHLAVLLAADPDCMT